jgi:hypothetical protein
VRRHSFLFIAVLAAMAFAWYVLAGETGPVGWIDTAQARLFGGYSRDASFLVLAAVVGIVVSTFRFLRASFASRGGKPIAPPPVATPLIDSFSWGWRTSLAVWLAGLALILASEFAWFTWDWSHRLDDAVGDYPELRLGRDLRMPPQQDGKHLALRGRLLWDHGAARTETIRSSEVVVLFVPMAGADWSPGDPVPFVAQIQPGDSPVLQGDDAGTRTPLRVRVAGAVPTVIRHNFERRGAPVAENGRLVQVIALAETQANPPLPTFDWKHAGVVAIVLAVFWVLIPGPLLVGLTRQARRRRPPGRPA